MPLTMTKEEQDTLFWSLNHIELSAEDVVRLKCELDAQETRRMELAEENMKLMADLSTAQTKLAEQQFAVEQFHRDADGHNFCFVNALRLFAAFGLIAKPLKLPPMDERMHGCAKFWEALEANSERWPDFVPVDDQNSVIKLETCNQPK